jgi:hypothetical protein
MVEPVGRDDRWDLMSLLLNHPAVNEEELVEELRRLL